MAVEETYEQFISESCDETGRNEEQNILMQEGTLQRTKCRTPAVALVLVVLGLLATAAVLQQEGASSSKRGVIGLSAGVPAGGGGVVSFNQIAAKKWITLRKDRYCSPEKRRTDDGKDPSGYRFELNSKLNNPLSLEKCKQMFLADSRCAGTIMYHGTSSVGTHCKCIGKGFLCNTREIFWRGTWKWTRARSKGVTLYGLVGGIQPLGQKFFRAVGQGICTDMGKKISSLFAYCLTEAECRAFCNKHGQCLGYDFGAPTGHHWQDAGQKACGKQCNLYCKNADVAFDEKDTIFEEYFPPSPQGKDINYALYDGKWSDAMCYKVVFGTEEAAAGDFYDGAEPFANVELITKGYNLYEGDPLPITSSSDKASHPEMLTRLVEGSAKTSMDPGLKKSVFAIGFSQRRLTGDRRHTVPDGYHVTVDEGCATVFATKQIRDEWEYKTEQTDTVSVSPSATATAYFPPPDKMSKSLDKMDITVGVQTSVGATLGGSLSYQLKDIQKQNRLRDQTMYRSQAKCSAYVAAISFVDPPKTHPDFQKAVDGVTSTQEYHDLFDEYGTHMLTLIKMGARFANTAFVSKQKSEDIRKTANGVGISASATISAGLDATIAYKESEVSMLGNKAPSMSKEWSGQLLSPPEKEVAEKAKQLIDRTTLSVIGPAIPPGGTSIWSELVKAHPVPFEYDSRDICLHPAIVADDNKFKLCREAANSYCKDHLVKRGANCEAAKEKECYEDLDCKEGFVCRTYHCVELPRCSATVWQFADYKGSKKYTLPVVDEVSHFGGAQFELANGNMKNNINSLKMSDGCLKAELVDDDGNCVLGKGDNLVARRSVGSLNKDLRNDVCMIKLWAKPAPLARPAIDRAGWVDLVGKQVMQSTNDGGGPERAIDQDTSSAWKSGSCTATNSEQNPWFEVDLGASYKVEAVKLWNRADCCGCRLQNLRIAVDGKVCRESVGVEQGQSAEVMCIGHGRKVKIQRIVFGILTICEVKVKAKCIDCPALPAWAPAGPTPAPPPKIEYFDMGGGNCPAGQEIMDPDKCRGAAEALGLWIKWQGGTADKAKCSHGHVPAGCWTRPASNSCWKSKSCALYINTNTGGKNNGNYRALCDKNPFFEMAGGNCPAGQEIMDPDKCKGAAEALGLWIKWEGGTADKAKASHGHVPAGCWTRPASNSCWKSKSCTLYINTNIHGKNNGNYRALCSALESSESRRLLRSAPWAPKQQQQGTWSGSHWLPEPKVTIPAQLPLISLWSRTCDSSYMDFYDDVYLAPRYRQGCWYDETRNQGAYYHNNFITLQECQQLCADNPECIVAGWQPCQCSLYKERCIFTSGLKTERGTWSLYPKRKAAKRWSKRKFVLAKTNYDCPDGIMAGGHPVKTNSLPECEKKCDEVETCRQFWWNYKDRMCKPMKSCGFPRKNGAGKIYSIDEERDPPKYLPNVGKAMYGYSTFYGAPASVEQAGTDPGFMHRPIWEVTYNRKTAAERFTFFDVPGFKSSVKPSFSEHKGVINTLTKLGNKNFTLAEAKQQCQDMGECTGFTCTITNGCVLRRGVELTKDNSGSFMSYVKSNRVEMMRQKQNTKLAKLLDYPIFFNAAAAKEACLARRMCTGITCKAGRCKLGEGAEVVSSPGDVTHAVAGRAVAQRQGWRRLAGTAATLVPDGWKANYGISAFCDTNFQTEEIKSAYEYEESSSINLNPYGITVGIGDFSFSLSHESKEFFSSTSKYKKAMYKTSAECVEYTIVMDGEPPSTSNNFQYAVDSLEKEVDFYHLFHVFGLHYPTTVVFGARFGQQQTIRESSFKELSKKTVTSSVSAEVSKSYEKTVKGVTLEGTVAVKVEYKKEEETSESREFEDAFEERKEFSLGKKLPPGGDVGKWVAAATGEAMPIRYALSSICEHPALASKKATCEEYHKTFCRKFLAKLDSEVRCQKERKPECLWDMDCLPHHVCLEGACLREPDCKVYVYPYVDLNGNAREFGPYYFGEAPQGRLVSLGGDVKSLKVSAGCEEVVFFDQDKCKDNHKDNVVIENRNFNTVKSIASLSKDLRNDICKMKITPKKYWAATLQG